MDIDDIKTALRSISGVTADDIDLAIAKATGRTNRDLAEIWGVSEGTIRNRLKKLHDKITKSGVEWSNYSR